MFINFSEYVESLNETLLTKYLYHGSLYDFNKFKNTTTFFSDSSYFAQHYAEQKSFDSGTDMSPIVYKVKLIGNIFDINNKEDYNKLEKELPDEIEYMYNNFGFTTLVNKKEYLLNLSGYYTDEPYDELKDLKVGDIFSNPEYKQDKYTVYKKNDEYLYYYINNSFDDLVSRNINKYSETFKEIYVFLSEYIKKVIPNTKYVYDDDIKLYLDTFRYKQHNWGVVYPSQENINAFDKLYKKFEKKIIELLVKKEYIYKFILKTKTEKLSDTWRFYENSITDNIIKQLGYCGYVALEKNVKTYAIFNPEKSVKIIKKVNY